MRITGNFNIPKINYTGILITDNAMPIVNQYRKESATFEDAYKALESTSNSHDEDIYIQRIIGGIGLNFQVLDPYSRDTMYYLAADQDPNRSAQIAVEKYNEFLSRPLPPRQALPTKEDMQQRTPGKKWRFPGIFGLK